MEELCSFAKHTLLRVVNKTPERIHDKPVFTTLPPYSSPCQMQTLPQAGKFGKRTPDAAFIPELSHVCWVSERAMLCHSTHLSQENWNHSMSNTLNDFPTSHLPHLLLSAQFDLFEPLCLQWHQQNCSITASSSAMEQCQALRFSLLQEKSIKKIKDFCFVVLSLPSSNRITSSSPAPMLSSEIISHLQDNQHYNYKSGVHRIQQSTWMPRLSHNFTLLVVPIS